MLYMKSYKPNPSLLTTPPPDGFLPDIKSNKKQNKVRKSTNTSTFLYFDFE